MKGGWEEFRVALGQRESSNRYDCVNAYGFLGRWQFGMMRLKDLGLMESDGRWKPGLSQQAFLANPALQDACFEAHVARHMRTVGMRFSFALNTPRGTKEDPWDLTLSGCVGVAHLLGIGGLASWLSGKSPTDAFGTTAAEYAKLFSGYNLPPDLKLEVPKELFNQGSKG